MKSIKQNLEDIFYLFKISLRNITNKITQNENQVDNYYYFRNKVKHLWIEQDQSIFKLLVDSFELVYQCVNLLWKPEKIRYYHAFSNALICINQLYNFFNCNEQQQQVDEIDNISNIQPQLSRLISQIPSDQQLQIEKKKSTMINQNFLDLIQDYKNQKAQLTLEDLNEIIKQKLINQICFFISSTKVQAKQPWMDMIENICSDQSQWKKLSIEIKVANIRAQAYKNAIQMVVNKYNLSIKVDRQSLWNSTFSQLIQHRPASLVVNKINIEFLNEQGYDAGGLSREWINLCFKELLNPNQGLFITSQNQITLHPNPLSVLIPNHLLHFRFAGRLMAKCLIDQLEVEISFTKFFLKHILKKNLYITDLEDIDPDLAQNLLWILENDITDQELNLTFSTQREFLQNIQIIDLIPNGRNIQVTEQNKKQFVKAFACWKMIDEIKDQLEAFTQGILDLIPSQALEPFNESEFGLLLYGTKDIDIKDMANNFIYEGYTEKSPQIIWLIQILKQLNEEQKQVFLFYVTGSFKVPYGGFKYLEITIEKSEQNNNSLPIAHTCFKTLELPVYQSQEILQDKLMLALTEGYQGFFIQ